MSNVIPFAGGAVPAYAARTAATPGMSQGMGGGSFNRIVLKMGLWRLEVDGQEIQQVQGPLPVIIHGFSANLSRQYYDGVYNPNDPPRQPDCRSSDGLRPTSDAPKPQSALCSTCPKTVKNASGFKDCAMKKRIIVSVYGDTQNRLFRLDIPAMSIFDKGNPQANLFGFKDYAAKIDESRIEPSAFITNLVPDMQASVAKYFFQPTGYLDEPTYLASKSAIDPAEVTRYLAEDSGAAAQAATQSAPGAAAVTPVADMVAPAHPVEQVVQQVQPVAEPVVQPVVVQPVVVQPVAMVVQPVAEPVTQTPASAIVIEQPAVVQTAVRVAQPVATTPSLATAEALLGNLGG